MKTFFVWLAACFWNSCHYIHGYVLHTAGVRHGELLTLTNGFQKQYRIAGIWKSKKLHLFNYGYRNKKWHVTDLCVLPEKQPFCFIKVTGLTDRQNRVIKTTVYNEEGKLQSETITYLENKSIFPVSFRFLAASLRKLTKSDLIFIK